MSEPKPIESETRGDGAVTAETPPARLTAMIIDKMNKERLKATECDEAIGKAYHTGRRDALVELYWKVSRMETAGGVGSNEPDKRVGQEPR